LLDSTERASDERELLSRYRLFEAIANLAQRGGQRRVHSLDCVQEFFISSS
jgi:hypothetical protein